MSRAHDPSLLTDDVQALEERRTVSYTWAHSPNFTMALVLVKTARSEKKVAQSPFSFHTTQLRKSREKMNNTFSPAMRDTKININEEGYEKKATSMSSPTLASLSSNPNYLPAIACILYSLASISMTLSNKAMFQTFHFNFPIFTLMWQVMTHSDYSINLTII